MATGESTLHSRISTTFEKSPFLKSRQASLEAHEGRVVLRGVVNSYYQKQMAQERSAECRASTTSRIISRSTGCSAGADRRPGASSRFGACGNPRRQCGTCHEDVSMAPCSARPSGSGLPHHGFFAIAEASHRAAVFFATGQALPERFFGPAIQAAQPHFAVEAAIRLSIRKELLDQLGYRAARPRPFRAPADAAMCLLQQQPHLFAQANEAVAPASSSGERPVLCKRTNSQSGPRSTSKSQPCNSDQRHDYRSINATRRREKCRLTK